MTYKNREKDLERLRELIQQISDNYGVDLSARHKGVPISIFGAEASPLVCLVSYLAKEHKQSEIATLLSRSPKTIHQAAKQPTPTFPPAKQPTIPLSAFGNRTLSITENLVTHLHENGMRFSQIAKHIKKDPRTVWTAWHRAQKKKTHHNSR